MPPFRYGEAKAAGVSDEDIARYLTKKRAAGEEVWIDPEEIKAVRSGQPYVPKPKASQQAALRRTPSRLPGVLSTVGGTIGGIAGTALGTPAGPVGMFAGGVRGAGIGGAGGEFLGELLAGEPLSAQKIGWGGVGQAGYEAFGQGAGRLVQGAARPFMRRSLGVGKALIGKPDPVEEALAQGVLTTPGGAAKVNRLREASAAELQSLLASTGGKTFNARDVSAPVVNTLQTQARVLPIPVQSSVSNQLEDFLSQHVVPAKPPVMSTVLDPFGNPVQLSPGVPAQDIPIDPTMLKGVKQQYQARANYDTPLPLTEAGGRLFAGDLASGAKSQLEQIPGVAEQEAKTQSLIALQDALEAAVARKPEPLHVMHPGTWPMVGLNSKEALSVYAQILNNPALRGLATQSPRTLGLIVQQLMLRNQSAPADALQQ